MKFLFHIILFLSSYNFLYPQKINVKNENTSKLFHIEFKPIEQLLLINNPTDPDNPCLCYGYQLSNFFFSIGQEFQIAYITTDFFKIHFSLGGVLFIHNFNPNTLFPSELWRGILFFTSYLEVNKNYLPLPPRHRIIFTFTLYHESDHVFNIQDYTTKYLISENFPEPLFQNGSFRSFEIIKNKVTHQYINNSHKILTSLGYKYYFAILSNLRHLQYLFFGVVFQLQYSYEILQTVTLSLSLYHEYTHANFTSLRRSYNFFFSDNALLTNIIELSLELSPFFKTKFMIYIAYSYSNGLGLNFFERNSGFNTGLRLFL